MIVAGSYTPETARSEAEARPNALIGFGRHFIANVSRSLFLSAIADFSARSA
jgi:2,4-dienoyl-CoA reductase-like NADH-dependent reductase (Old Yellow Enzyme family)